MAALATCYPGSIDLGTQPRASYTTTALTGGNMKRSLATAVSVCVLCVFSACSNGNNNSGGGTPKTLSISGTLPATGTVGAAYAGMLSAVGGVPPYTWTVTGLPAGVTPAASTTSTETIMGTPTTAATSTVSVSLSDSSGLSASQTFTIVIPTTTAVTCTSRGNESVLTASAPFAFLVKANDANFNHPIAIAGSFTPNGDGTIKA